MLYFVALFSPLSLFPFWVERGRTGTRKNKKISSLLSKRTDESIHVRADNFLICHITRA